MDMRQPPKDGQSVNAGEHESHALSKAQGEDNWWPGIGRWRLGMVCEEATLELGHPEVFEP